MKRAGLPTESARFDAPQWESVAWLESEHASELLPTMVQQQILSPTGEELKRVSLKELKGRVESVRLGRNNSCAFILTTETVDEEKKKYIYRGYFIDLIGKTTPKIVIQKDYSFTWVINRDATLAYGSEGDPKVVMEPHEVQPQLQLAIGFEVGKGSKNRSACQSCHH